MSDEKPRHELVPALDRLRGRQDDVARLRAHLGDAPADYLAGALENENLGPEGVRLLLKNRFATRDIVGRVGKNRDWMRTRDVRTAFVANPLASVVVARQVLPFLFWMDLADVATNLRLSPTLRREAEKVLRARVGELSSGERTTLARRPSRGIVEMLRDQMEPAILQALAGNARTTEADIIRIVSRLDVPSSFLSWLGSQSPWGRRREVMMVLIRHSRTPYPVALRLIQALGPGELDTLRRDESVPRLLRVAAERRAATIPDERHGEPWVG